MTLGFFLPSLLQLISRVQDEKAAAHRLDAAYAPLESATEFCGYGLPRAGDDCRARFGLPGVAPFNWAGPITTGDLDVGTTRRSGGLCRIVYAVPSGVRCAEETVSPTGRFAVRLTENPHLLDQASGTPNLIKNWAIFGAMQPSHYPLWLESKSTGAGGNHATLRGQSASVDLTIPRNDEIFYLRALELRVRRVASGSDVDYILYANDYTGSGVQPRVEGIVDMRFELTGEKLLRVSILARGNTKYNTIATSGTPPGWPEAYAADIPAEMRYFKLFAKQRSFELMNL